jgi:predicted lipase
MGRKRKDPPQPTPMPWVEDHVAAASLAYKDDHVSDLNSDIKLSEKWTFLKTIDGASGCRAKIWVSKENGNILCSFRGTQSIKEAKLDADFALTGFDDAGGQGKGNIHRGFSTGFIDLRDQLTNELRVMRDMGYLPKGAALQFSGHSLGGALSDIASTYYAGMFPEIQVISTTLGAPMTGDKDFANYSRSLPNLTRSRIVSERDPVAKAPIPGMQHIEQQNVLDFRRHKEQKGESILDTIERVGIALVSGASAGVLMAVGGKQMMDAHGLDYYQKVLSEDFKENRVDNVNQMQEEKIQQNEEAYAQSKESEAPAAAGTCDCDCHYHDIANAKGEVPPQSTGAIEQMQPVNNDTMVKTSPVDVNVTTNTFDQPIQTDQATDQLVQQDTIQNTTAESQPNEIMDQIKSALDAQKDKERKTLEKLQEQYALLTNQTDQDMDDISKERQSFQKDQEDIQYFENRIQMELDHPEYVKDDSYDSKNKAVAFKNRINRLYNLILSANSKYKMDMKNTKAPDQDDIERNTADDQVEQMEGARNAKNLNPDEQTGEFVFDVTKLTDLDATGDAPVSTAQLEEWLAYPDMTSRTLYETLKQDMTAQYREDRMNTLRQTEQDHRKTAAEKIKSQLDNYTNVDKTGIHDKLNETRDAFFTKLSTNPNFMRLINTKQLNVQALVSKYQKDGDDVSIMNDILGYDPKTVQDSMSQAYTQQLMNIPTSVPPADRARMMQEAWKQYQVNTNYPWVSSDKFKAVYEKYKDDPDKLALEVEGMRPTLPASYRTNNDMLLEQTGLNGNLMNQQVQELTNNSKEIVQQQFKDYYKAYREQQLASFKDNDKVKEMFKTWNPEKTWTQKAAGEIKDFATLYTTKHGGWYDKEGNYLGAVASPDFEDYVRKNPNSGFKYVKEDKNAVLDMMWEMGGEGIAMMYGINPTAAIDNMAGGTKDTNGNGVFDSGDTEFQPEEMFNPFALLGGGKDKEE